MILTFLAWVFFLIHHRQKKIKKRPEPKKFFYQKIIVIMPVSRAYEFLKYVLYIHTFLQKLPIARAQIWAVIEV